MSIEGITDLEQRLHASQQEVLTALDDITNAELHSAPAAGDWTVAEVCAHVIEMQMLWLRKIANAARDPDLKRSEAESERRTALIEAHALDDIGTVRRRLDEANNWSVGILRGIGPATLDVETSRGTVREAIHSLVTSHVSEHAKQINDIRSTLRSS